MQVFVQKSSLTGAPDEVANVLAFYDESITIDPNTYPNASLMFLPSAAIDTSSGGGLPVLVANWRNTYQIQVLSGEANRRITSVFPDYSQRNSNAEINGYITQYGADPTVWPAGVKSRKAEIDRCWTYVNDVRLTANAMAEATLPVDPTADGNWPAIVPPYVPS